MKKACSSANEEVRRICRDINQQSDDREQLQSLVVRLQEVLSKSSEVPGKNRDVVRMVGASAQRDNPFDRIMIG